MNEKGDDSDQSMDFEEIILETNNDENRSDDLYFDVIIGHIEDLVMDDNFQCLTNNFLDKYWTEFEDLDENKFIYMDIFKEYVETVENYIDTHLTSKIQGFCMEDFLRQLEAGARIEYAKFEDRILSIDSCSEKLIDNPDPTQKYDNSDLDNELEGEIFEMLLTFTDFLRFKQMFLDYRAMKEGKYDGFTSGILITSIIPTACDINEFVA